MRHQGAGLAAVCQKRAALYVVVAQTRDPILSPFSHYQTETLSCRAAVFGQEHGDEVSWAERPQW